MDTRDVELIDYLRLLWRWKWLIGGGWLLAVLLAWVVTAMTPNTYKATVLLLIAESKIPPPEGPAGRTSVAELAPETFEAILKSQSLASETIRHFGLEKKPFFLSPEQFRQHVLVVEVRRTANLLALSAILPDAPLAAEVANFVAHKAVAINTALNQSDTVSTKDYIQTQRDNAKEAMQRAQGALVDFKQSAGLERLRADQKILLEAKRKLAQLHQRYTIQLTGLQASVAGLKANLGEHEPLLTVNKSIFDDPALLAAAQDRNRGELKALSALQLKSQEVNKVYQQIQRTLIDRETNLVAAQSQRDDVEHKLTDANAALAEVEKKIAETEARLEELTRNYTLEKTAYELFATKLHEAAISVASRSAALKVVDPAIVPTGRLRPRLLLNLVVAGTVGLMMSVTLVFFLAYLQQAARNEK